MQDKNDILIRGVTTDGTVRFIGVTSTGIVERAREIHHLRPLATAALGRALTAASMMGAELKGQGSSLTIQIRGGGPLGSITVVSDNAGNVRGYLQNGGVELPLRPDGKLDVGSGVGADGTLTVIKDLNMREPFVGTIGLVGGEIAEDIAAYYAESEQIPSSCALGVLVGRDMHVRAAGGFLIELLPGATEETVTALESSLAELPPVTAMLDDGLSMEDILSRALSKFTLDILSRDVVKYKCACGRDKVARALISLGAEELSSMADEKPVSEVTCQFCDAVYCFTSDELHELIKSAK